jgi:ketosteroid isomerase-like protein
MAATVPAENLKTLQQSIDAFAAGDLDAWIEGFAEDVVWIPEVLDLEPVAGRNAYLEAVRRYLEPWDRVEFETVELEEIGDVVIRSARQTVWQERSQLTFTNLFWGVFEFRDGLVTRYQTFWDRDAALTVAQERSQAQDERTPMRP